MQLINIGGANVDRTNIGKKYVNVPQISDCVYGFDLMIDLM